MIKKKVAGCLRMTEKFQKTICLRYIFTKPNEDIQDTIKIETRER